MKAQMKYFERKAKTHINQTSSAFVSAVNNFFDDDYLWSYTKRYYLFTVIAFALLRKRLSLHPLAIIPCMSLPMLTDHFKREFYLLFFKEEKKKLNESRKILSEIINHKKSAITIEEVYAFIFGAKINKHSFDGYKPIPDIYW